MATQERGDAACGAARFAASASFDFSIQQGVSLRWVPRYLADAEARVSGSQEGGVVSADVTPRLKPAGPCGCGCELDTTYRAKPWRDGTLCCRSCACRRCLGRRNRARGDSKAARARRKLGLGGARTRHEELWRGALRTEVKSGAKAKPVQTFYENCRAQSDAAKAVGDLRPFVAIGAPLGTSKTFCVIEIDDLATLVAAL